MDTCAAQTCTAAWSGSSNIVFAQLIQTLLAAQCDLKSDHVYPPDRVSDVLDRLPDGEFDFIIVGGGTAGSVVARRLSEISDWDVLLIERGENPSISSDVPGLFMTLYSTAEDYRYHVEPGNYCLAKANKRCIWSKGKALGGSSAINAMYHIHGNQKDYDAWAELGNEGWDFESVLPYFRKSENYDPAIPKKFGQKYFGTDGPVSARHFNYSNHALRDLLSDALRELKVPILDVLNGKEGIGFGTCHVTAENSLRLNAAKAYLHTVKDKKNLFVMKSARADSVVLDDGKRATGVKVSLPDGNTVEVKAKKEVILSAGSVATPQLLMLSGIGPKEELEKHGIDLIAELPVGKNLQDHVLWLGFYFTCVNNTVPPATATEILDASYNFLVHRKGVHTFTGGIDFAGFINTKDKNASFPNIQFLNVHLPRGHSFGIAGIGNTFALGEETMQELFNVSHAADIIFVAPILLHPKSVGEVKLRSANPDEAPRIFANYFTHDDDIKDLIDSVNFVQSLVKTESFKKYDVKQRRYNIEACKGFPEDSRGYWECNLRHTGTSLFHPVGTAKMGPAGDPGAVVDQQLRVHGIRGLRVIDASIMPLVPSGNTNSPTLMIAEKGADMILKNWGHK